MSRILYDKARRTNDLSFSSAGNLREHQASQPSGEGGWDDLSKFPPLSSILLQVRPLLEWRVTQRSRTSWKWVQQEIWKGGKEDRLSLRDGFPLRGVPSCSYLSTNTKWDGSIPPGPVAAPFTIPSISVSFFGLILLINSWGKDFTVVIQPTRSLEIKIRIERREMGLVKWAQNSEFCFLLETSRLGHKEQFLGITQFLISDCITP